MTSADPGRLPDFLILGGHRCGTSWLWRNLADQPGVYSQNAKELHFFDKHYGNGVGWYREQFAGSAAGQRCGEATAAYLTNLDAPARIAETLPDARFIVLLRDPVDRVYSHYWLYHARGWVQEPFADCVERALGGDDHLELLQRSRFGEAIGRHLACFEAARFLVLDHADIATDPAAVLARACRHLGIEAPTASEHLHTKVNRYQGFRSRRLWRWARTRPWAKALVGRVNRVDAEYPPMNGDLWRRLEEYFRPDQASLRTLRATIDVP